MDRRNFLSTFFGTAAGLVMSKELDADLLPWKESTLVLPPAEPALLTAQVIMREFMERLDSHMDEYLPIKRMQLPESPKAVICLQRSAEMRLGRNDLRLYIGDFSRKYLDHAALSMSLGVCERAKKDNANSLYTRELDLPDGCDMAARASHRGLSIRMLSDIVPTHWDPDCRLLRFDMAYSFTPDMLPA